MRDVHAVFPNRPEPKTGAAAAPEDGPPKARSRAEGVSTNAAARAGPIRRRRYGSRGATSSAKSRIDARTRSCGMRPPKLNQPMMCPQR